MDYFVTSDGCFVHPRAPLFGILSRLTQLTALELGLALKGNVAAPLELPRLQLLNVHLTTECRPAQEYASLQSTTLTSLTFWGDTITTEDDDPQSVSNNLPPSLTTGLY